MRLLLLSLCLLGGCISEKRMARASARAELGVAYFREGSEEAAIVALKEAHELDPRNWRALSALGVVYVAKGKNDLAEEAFRDALRINPGEAEILLNYGAFLVRNGRPEEAIGHLERALEDLDYRSPAMILSNLSYALLQVDRVPEAVARAREAVHRVPNLCEGHYHLGLALEAAGDPGGALAAWSEQERVCPTESSGARLAAACLRAKQGDPGALDELDAVVREAPTGSLAEKARSCIALLGAR